MHIFLKLKSWQLFILLLGIPVFAYLLIGSSLTEGNEANFFLMGTFEFVLYLMVLSWFWILGSQLNLYVSKGLRPHTKFFRIGIIFVAVYTIILQAFLIFTLGSYSLNDMVIFILPLNLLTVSFMLYSIYFMSKNLVLAEKDEKVKSEELIGPFFALWFFPIGIWFIQPRINALYNQSDL